MNRKKFIQSFGITGLAVAGLPIITKANNDMQGEPQLDKALVATFVGAGHRDMDKVKALLEETPNLLNAAHDWKYGDFETCLGAASHVGFKELALYLLEKGAQANIFTACLFGKIEIVKPMLEAFPHTLHAKGPHGFTLLHHAQQGGDEALAVKEYLESLGAKETKVALY
jgi:hypothetical protein